MKKARDSRHELYHKRSHPDTQKKCFTLRTINHWNNLCRNVVESSSLTLLRGDWAEYLIIPCKFQKLDQVISQAPFQSVLWIIMWFHDFTLNTRGCLYPDLNRKSPRIKNAGKYFETQENYLFAHLQK